MRLTLFSAEENIPGACSTVNIQDVHGDNNWHPYQQAVWNEKNRRYIRPEPTPYTLKDAARLLRETALNHSDCTGCFVSLDTEIQTKAIEAFKALGFKFTRAQYNDKNETKVKLGVVTMPSLLSHCREILKDDE